MVSLKRIQTLLSSRDVRTLSSNFIWLCAIQFVSYLFPIFTLPYLARVIGVDGFGKIAFASAVIGWVITIVNWGFNYTATRDVARNRDSIDKVSVIFTNVFWARMSLMIVSFAILFVLTLVIPQFYEDRLVIFVTFLLVPGQIMFPSWLFQGLERMKYISILSIISRILFTLLVFLFIRTARDFILQPLFTALGEIMSGIIAFIILRKWGIRLYRCRVKDVCVYLKKSLDVFINDLAPNLYNSFSIVLLGIVGGTRLTGIFEAASKFITISMQFLSIIGRTFFPYLSRKLAHHNQYAIINFLVSILISTIIFIFAPLIIDYFYTTQFKEAILCLRLLSLSIPFLSLSQIYGTNYLIIVGKEKVLRNVTILISVIGFVFAVPMVSKWYYLGAALTITGVRIILGIVITLISLKHKRNCGTI